MDDLSVSIVTPSYNQSRFIEDTLRSVAVQTYDSVEHIVIDGESTDETVEILERHDEIEWTSEPDEGQSDAINKGFNQASGDIVGWLNSDDVYFDTEVLDRVVYYFEQTGADVVYGDMGLIGPDSEILSIQVVPDFDYDRLLRGCFIEQPALFFRSHVLENNRLNTNLEYVMDYEFWLRLAREYEFHHVNDVLAGDRNHSQRKIINQRDSMEREALKIQRRYGAPSNSRLELERRLDLLVSGIPRTLRAVVRTTRIHRNPPELAFDGQFGPLNEMVENVFRPNRDLVPDTADHLGVDARNNAPK